MTTAVEEEIDDLLKILIEADNAQCEYPHGYNEHIADCTHDAVCMIWSQCVATEKCQSCMSVLNYMQKFLSIKGSICATCGKLVSECWNYYLI